jgi:hypothetical protein
MAIVARENRREWTQAPEGLHQAICVDVIDLGLVKTEWGEKQKVRLIFQLGLFNEDGTEELSPDFDPPKRYEVRRDFGLSLGEKSSLRPFLEAWRGRKFTKEELAGFDLEKLIDANCQVQVIHNISDQGRTFANIQAAVPLGRGMQRMHAQDYVRQKDRAATSSEHHGASEYDDSEVPF